MHRLDRDAVHRVDAALGDRGIARDDPQAQGLWRELATAAPAARERIVLAARAQHPEQDGGDVARDRSTSAEPGEPSHRMPDRGPAPERGGREDPQADRPRPEPELSEAGQSEAGQPGGRIGSLRGNVERATAAREQAQRGPGPRMEPESEAHRRRTHHDPERTDTERDRDRDQQQRP